MVPLAVRTAALALALAGCTAGLPQPLAEPVEEPLPGPVAFEPVAARTPLPPSPAATAAAATTAGDNARPPSPTPPPVTRVAFTGDVHGEWPIASVLARGENPLAALRSVFRQSDLTVVNLETAVTTSGVAADKSFTFRADPALLPALREVGVDVVSLANNHALDYGSEALAETLERSRTAGLWTVGAGADADEAYAPAILDTPGGTVAVVGLSRVLPDTAWMAAGGRPGLASAYQLEPAVQAVAAAREAADFVVVTIHWGQERALCPDGNQLRLADALVAAGADVVAGHHSHVLGGIQQFEGAVVAWSLGNFLFASRPGPGRDTVILLVELTETAATWQIVPAVITADGTTVPARGPDAARIRRAVAERSPGGRACPQLP